MSKTISIKDEDHATIKNAQHILLNKYNMNVSVQNIISEALISHSEIAERIGKRSKSHGLFKWAYTRSEEPNSDNKIFIYTAGKMPSEGENISDTWRGILENGIKNKNINTKWLHPTLEGCDHSGVMPEATVRNDLDLIEQSDLVIGYFDQPELYGTVTEILYAASIGKKIGLIFLKKNLSSNHDWKSNHGCTCCWEAIDPHCQAHEYWFMERLFIDYLSVGRGCGIYEKQLVFYMDDIELEIRNNNDTESYNEPEIKYIEPDLILEKLINEFDNINKIVKGDK